MGDFSNSNHIVSIKEIVSQIDLKQTTIKLNHNNIKKAKLELLPDNVLNVYMEYNLVDIVSWDVRNWGTISLKNNNFNTEEFDGFECDKLILDNNDIKIITFANCKINHLSIINNEITSINFFDCYIEVLDLSENYITNIITLPTGLKKLTLSSNKIQNFSTELPNGLNFLDISNNKLIQIPNISSTLKYLDLSKNKIKTFDPTMIPLTLDYFDITENKISNCNEKFTNLKDNIKNIYFDSDDENENNDDTNISDETSEITEFSDVSELDEIKLNYVNSHTNNYREIKIDDDESVSKSLNGDDNSDPFFNDEEIENAINEYKNSLEEEKQQESEQISELPEKIADSINTQNKKNMNNAIGNLNDREMVLRTALERFRNGGNSLDSIKKQVIVKNVYLPLIPIELKWNINLN
jgi:hypothetical protein